MDGQNSQTFDPSKLTVKEVKELQTITDKSFGQIIKDFRTENFDASVLQAVIYLFKKRSEPDIKFEDVEDVEIGVMMGQNGDSPNP